MVLGDNDTTDLYCTESLFYSPSTSKCSNNRESLGHLTPSASRKRPLATQPQRPRASLPPPVDYEKKPNSKLNKMLNCHDRPSVLVDVDVGIHYKNSDRVLKNLFKMQTTFTVSKNMMIKCQKYDEVIYHRPEVVRFMEDVCKVHNADACVIPLAVQFFDRFLCIKTIHLSMVSSVGLACVILASKIKAPDPITAKKVMELRCTSATLDQLIKWEETVAQVLGFNLSTPTCFEFFDHLLYCDDSITAILVPIWDLIINQINVLQQDLELSCLLPSDQMAIAVLNTVRNHPVYRFLEGIIYKHFVMDLDAVDIQMSMLDCADNTYCQPAPKYRKPRIINEKQTLVRRPPAAL